MPSLSRRRALQTAAGYISILAGCNSRPNSATTPTPTARSPPNNAVTDPPTVSLRNPNGSPVVTNHGEATTDNAEADDHLWRHTLVADEETADELVFADVEDVERARQFLAETDFDTETVYVEQNEVGECYTRELCWVRWTESVLETSYAVGYRDADVACDSDADDAVAQLVRLPVALDPDRIHSFSSNSGSGGCRIPTSKEERA